jgi:hypothetical protein
MDKKSESAWSKFTKGIRSFFTFGKKDVDQAQGLERTEDVQETCPRPAPSGNIRGQDKAH